MIAIAILALCFMPLVGTPTWLLKGQVAALEEAAVLRQAAVDFADIKAGLYQNTISWETILNSKAISKRTQSDLELKPVLLYIPEERKFDRSVYFYSEEKGSNLDDRLVNVHLSYQAKGKKKPYKYKYQIYAKKTGK